MTISRIMPWNKVLAFSIKEVGKSKQPMIYGFAHCKYGTAITVATKSIESDKTFDKILSYKSLSTLEGGGLAQIDFTPSYHPTAALCKSKLVNLVYENYKREKMGLELIPLLFFMDVEGNPYPLNPKDWTSKDPKFKYAITFKEIRRLYKICEFIKTSGFSSEQLEKDKELRDACKAIERIGKKMFIPVRLNADHTLTELPFPWLDKEFPSSWETRKKSSNPASASKINWRTELTRKIIQFDPEKGKIQAKL